MDRDNRGAVITGGAQGIGCATALPMLASGASVQATDAALAGHGRIDILFIARHHRRQRRDPGAGL